MNESCCEERTCVLIHSSLLSLYFRCGPCKFIAPIFEALAEENPDCEFVKVDVDENEEAAAACGIQAMPTFQVYKNGKKVDEMRGASKDGLAAMVAKYKQ